MDEPLDLTSSGKSAAGGSPTEVQRDPTKPLRYWVKRFLACNPFYLASAAVLLFGLYRVSIDTNFLRGESAQLFFNLGSLQCYEILLVVTAVFLARRSCWYDSTLLVSLENMLVLAPFILISQAALIDVRLVWTLCLAAGFLATARFAGLKRKISELNFPFRAAAPGLLILGVNVALPIVYRLLHENKVGTRPDFGAAYYANQCAWLLVLPALFALANLLPPPRNRGELLPQRGWLPAGWFSLWLAGTVVHLYCLGYVYDFDLRRELTAPAVWTLLWTLQFRASSLAAAKAQSWRPALLMAPAAATALAPGQPRNELFLALTLLNAALYGRIAFRHRSEHLPLFLFLFSIVALAGGIPEDWGARILPEFSHSKGIGLVLTAYVLIWAAASRDPKVALGGAVALSLAVFMVLRNGATAPHWALQAGLAFLLLHSLRWVDAEHPGANALRIFAALAWIAHAWVWMRMGAPAWMPLVTAVPLLVVYSAMRLIDRCWGPLPVPVAAILALSSGPSSFTVEKVPALPMGLLAVLISFLLFGLGTLLALTRQRWTR
jgi:hypothetical protein